MKKVIKYRSKLDNQEITITIDENLKPTDPTKGLVARKLKEANESLKKMKGLPKLSS